MTSLKCDAGILFNLLFICAFKHSNADWVGSCLWLNHVLFLIYSFARSILCMRTIFYLHFFLSLELVSHIVTMLWIFVCIFLFFFCSFWFVVGIFHIFILFILHFMCWSWFFPPSFLCVNLGGIHYISGQFQRVLQFIRCVNLVGMIVWQHLSRKNVRSRSKMPAHEISVNKMPWTL